MKKIIIPILITTAVFISCHKRVTETDRTTAVGYAKKANLYRAQGKVDSAEFFFQKAFALDKNNIKYRYALMGIYSEQKKFDRAFKLLEGTPESEKNSVFYFQTKGNILDLQGKYDLAREEYLKAYKISKAIDVKNEKDLYELINYTMLETLAGKKKTAVNKLNETLKLDWLSQRNIEYLKTFRNEFEYYQGDGTFSFDFKKDIALCTKNTDSLEAILFENHINVSGSNGEKVFISEKYRSGLQKLDLKPCEE